jgi:Ulp1 family protease
LEKIKTQTLHNIPDIALFQSVQKHSDKQCEINDSRTMHKFNDKTQHTTVIDSSISHLPQNLGANILEAIQNDPTSDHLTIEIQDSNIWNLPPTVLEKIRSETPCTILSLSNFQNITICGISITRQLLHALCDPTEWLNDQMINAYMKLLGAAYTKSFFFSSYFLACLARGDNMNNWVDNLILTYEKLIFPIHVNGNHWYT